MSRSYHIAMKHFAPTFLRSNIKINALQIKILSNWQLSEAENQTARVSFPCGSVTALVCLQSYWSSRLAVAIVLGASGIVPVLCSTVLSKGGKPLMWGFVRAATSPFSSCSERK